MDIKKKDVFTGTEAECTYCLAKSKQFLFGHTFKRKKLNKDVIFIRLNYDDYVKLEDLEELEDIDEQIDTIQHYYATPRHKGDKYVEDLQDYYTLAEKEDIVKIEQILGIEELDYKLF